MKQLLLWFFISVFIIFVAVSNIIFGYDPARGDFLIKCGLAFGTLIAVLIALFGDYLRELIDPIRVTIEVPTQSNTVIDQIDLNKRIYHVYHHHLVVRNLTSYRTIKDCRVWLKRIFILQADNEWKDEAKFAVPRLMEWAPSEYSPDKRTFSNEQVFDLGKTFENNMGFVASYCREQHGAVPQLFPTGHKLRFVFFVTADNYQKEKEFTFEIDVVKSVQGDIVTPAKVKAI
jgi:hypothetical protein